MHPFGPWYSPSTFSGVTVFIIKPLFASPWITPMERVSNEASNSTPTIVYRLSCLQTLAGLAQKS